MRYNAITTYRDTFVKGIQKVLVGGRLYPNLLQCVTATARISSSDPNLLNQPRGATFPVRRAFISRFSGGMITNRDKDKGTAFPSMIAAKKAKCLAIGFKTKGDKRIESLKELLRLVR